VYAFYSFGGTELVAVAAGETAHPWKAVPNAVKATFFRIVLFYTLTILTIGLCINWQDPTLLRAAYSETVILAYHSRLLTCLICRLGCDSVSSDCCIPTCGLWCRRACRQCSPAYCGIVCDQFRLLWKFPNAICVGQDGTGTPHLWVGEQEWRSHSCVIVSIPSATQDRVT
jgi:hypothetical protein